MSKSVGTIMALGLMGFMSGAEACDTDMVLVVAHIQEMEIEESALPQEGGVLDFSSNVEVVLRVDDVLDGTLSEGNYSSALRMGALPTPANRNIFLLARTRPGARLEAVAWGYVSEGICIDPTKASEMGISRGFKKLELRGKINCP